MNKFNADERGESPYDVGFYVFGVLLVMAFLMTVVGAFLDQFRETVSGQTLTSAWGISTLATYLNYINWAYRIPIIFIIIVLIWGVRAVIRKHTYTKQNGQEYQNYEE